MIYASVFINKGIVKLFKVQCGDDYSYEWTSIGSYHTQEQAASEAEHRLAFSAETGSYFHYIPHSIAGFPTKITNKFITGNVGL